MLQHFHGHITTTLAPISLHHQNYAYAWRHGWRWVLGFLRHGRLVPGLREFYWVFVRGHDSESCADCGRPYMLWWAPDDLWERFAKGAGLCCPNCFDKRACEQGVWLRWRPEEA